MLIWSYALETKEHLYFSGLSTASSVEKKSIDTLIYW